MARFDFNVKREDGKEFKLAVIDITNEIRASSNNIYNTALQDALSKNFLLNAEIEKLLEIRQLNNPTLDEEQIETIRKNLVDMEKKLRSAIQDGQKMTQRQGKLIALAMKKERVKLYQVGKARSELFNKTAESYADNQRLLYFIYACTVDAENGDKYWSSFDEFKKDGASVVYSEASTNFFRSVSGVNLDFESQLYENKWLMRNKMLNSKLQFINSDGQTTDEDGRLINSEGRYIDSKGGFVDFYGNSIDSNGNLLMKDEWEEDIITKVGVSV